MESSINFHPQSSYIPNVAVANGVMCVGVSAALNVAALVWVSSKRNETAEIRLRTIEYMLDRLWNVYPDHQIWLLAGHRIAQPDNRITRYNGLWNSLRKRGLDIPKNRPATENLIEIEGGLRFFGAIPLEGPELEKALKIAASESGAVIALKNGTSLQTIENIVTRGWAMCNTTPPEEILEAVCEVNGLVVSAYDEFDDAEFVGAIFGRPETVKALHASRAGSGNE